MNKQFWKNKRVFLSGHTGFKGGWLSLWLQQLGANLTGYALTPPTQPNLFEVANVESGMKSIIGDIRDGNNLKHAMSEANPEVVIHMAAQPLVNYSYSCPEQTYSTNVMGLVNLFEAVRATPSVKSVVNVTCAKCYENKEWPWAYRENDPMGGYDPYSNSKGCAELITSCYRNSYFNSKNYGEHGVAIATARVGNVIGGGDWAENRLISDMIRAISKGESVEIRNPNAIRPWQHVLEPLSGYLKLVEKLHSNGTEFAEGWNFGPHDNEAITVGDTIHRFIKTWGSKTKWSLDYQKHPHEATYLKLDCSKAHSRLDWHPAWNIDLTIEKVVEWHKAYYQGADMRLITLAQINSY